MTLLDLTLPTPAQNLACDEALLDAAEEGAGGEVLRFWESTTPFVVVGYANHISLEVNRAMCEAKQIPILRRCSGGGTVVQGHGCLNYSLILRIDHTGPLQNITAANRFIMDRNRATIEELLQRNGETRTVQVSGHTDLSINGLKFSGNAQRRRKQFLLFHGALLLNFDLTLVQSLLPMPSRQPDYRANRSHGDFLTNLNLPAADTKSALRHAWNAIDPLEAIPHDRIATLTRDRYETSAWNFKF